MNSRASARADRGPLRFARTIVGAAAYPAIAFVGAWRLDWARGWVYLVLFVSVTLVGVTLVDRANPGLMAARSRGMRQDTKSFDRLFYAGFIPLMVVYPLLAGLDGGRFAWAPLPAWTAWLGVVLFVAGSAFTTWAMAVNRHAEGTVRIQSDRGHAVISDGPYGFVRHPIYVGTIAGLPAAALVLGLGWALLPMALIVALFVWRTALEDRTLQRELGGYADYAAATPYRLVPGIW